MSGVKISVITPVFNSGKTIGATIESVMSQSYSNWEHICVDDGSTDDTISVIKDYCKRDSRLKLLVRESEPKGGSSCRNIGATAASGEYLIFLDADDELLPHCLESRAKFLVETSLDFAAFRTDYYCGDKSNRKNFCRFYYKHPEYVFAAAQSPWQTSSSMFRTEFFRSIDGFDATFPRLQDIEFHLRALIKSNGNYSFVSNQPADSLYKMDAYEQNVGKIKKSIDAYLKFLNLVNEHFDSLYRSYYRSLAIFVVYCSIIIYYDLLKRQGVDYIYALNEKDNLVLVERLNPIHRYSLLILSKTQGGTINFYLAKIFRKLALFQLRF